MFLGRCGGERLRVNADDLRGLSGSLTRSIVLLVGLLGSVLSSASGFAQEQTAVMQLTPLAAGVTLPVKLSRSLVAGKVVVGTKLTLKTTQRVPVGESLYLKPGAAVEGDVVTSTAGDERAGHPSMLAIRLTALRYGGQVVPLRVRAVAIANSTDVEETLAPANGSTDRGNPSPASWTTRQVGGDEVYRSGWVGDVCDSVMRKVGYADYDGVYSLPRAGATLQGPALPRAMGVFSTTAAGLYGFDEGAVLRSGDGVMTISEPGRKLVLRHGDNLLLEVE